MSPRFPAFFALPLLLAACDVGTGPAGDLDGVNSDPKILGGDAPDAAEHDAVVALHLIWMGKVMPAPFCTGTLIEEDIVLTAAHCLDEAWGGTSYAEMDPADVVVYVGDNPVGDLTGNTTTVDELLIHVDYDRINLENDIGILRLSAPVTSVTPVPALDTSVGWTNADAGIAINFAGFGETETGSYGQKLQVDGVFGGLGCAVSGCWDAGIPATQVSYSQTSVQGTCSGDSGGPMFVDRSGTVYVGAITSYGDWSCAQYGVSTRVDAFETWISDFVSGSSSTTPASCGDGTCDLGESCDGRGASTLCTADCDGQLTGFPLYRFCDVGPYCMGPGCS